MYFKARFLLFSQALIMNNKEIGRFKIMQGLHNKTLKQKEAGLELSLSIRQIKRLYKRYKKNGIKGLISKKRGNPSNNQLSQHSCLSKLKKKL